VKAADPPPTAEADRLTATLPAGSGLALLGAAMMVIGAFGPWIGGRFFSATSGIELGGDGWLVLAAASLALVPVVLPVAGSTVKGGWVAALAFVAGYVCWTHYAEARSDGSEVVWGLELAGIGCGLLTLSAIRFLYDRS
jgi:hypothetical protein